MTEAPVIFDRALLTRRQKRALAQGPADFLLTATVEELVARLSAGQKRRTALACLIARRARLWLLDEPHAGLDARSRDELDAVLREAAAAGATVMVASHELERAAALADRVVTVAGGQIVGDRPC